jgi:methionyl-tRNA formyltransferase
MRIVLFGSGSPLSTAALDAVAKRFPVVAAVVPGGGRRGTLRARARALVGASVACPLVRLARRLGVPTVPMVRVDEASVAVRLARLSPDLLCVASFPLLLRAPLLRVSRLGAVGVHPSLLPRHRGGWPLFWTYFDDDRDCGVTVHWLDAGVDTGDIILQEALPLPRGEPVTLLYGEIARRGAALLVRAIEAIESGTAPRIRQGDRLGTLDPNPARGSWRRDVMAWDAERLWHFLRGLGDRHGELLTDGDGRPVAHGAALGFSLEPHDRRAGTLESLDTGGWRVFCRDGVVDTAGPTLRTTLRRVVRKLL